MHSSDNHQIEKTEHLDLFRGIRARLAISFCLLFVIVLSVVQIMGIEGIPLTEFKGQRGQLVKNSFHELNIIADAKKERLLYWMNERRSAANFLAANDLVEGAVANLRAAVGSAPAKAASDAQWAFLQDEKSFASMVRFFDKIRYAYGFYESIKIADVETGKILVSTLPEETGKNISSHIAFSGALRTRSGFVSDMIPAPSGDVPFFYISDIIKNNGKAVAVLILEIDSEMALSPLLQSGDELGKTGETLLVNREISPMNRLRYPLPDNSLARPFKTRLRAIPAAKAAQGEEGSIEVADYRGVPVLAAYRFLSVTPDWGWGMIVKVDRKELFAPIDEQVGYSILLAILGCVGVILCSVVLASSLTTPLLYITQAANRFAAGDLSVRSGLKRRDEIGILSRSLDKMADTIQETMAGLQHRTGELQQTTIALEQQRQIQEDALAVSTSLASSVGLEDLLDKGLSQLMAITNSQVGAVYLRGSGDEEPLHLALASGVAPGGELPAEIRPGDGLLGLSAQRETVEILSDIPESTRFTINTVAGEILPNSIVSISLLLHDQIVGVISLASIYPLSSQQLEVIHMTRSQLAIAISNARVHTETRRLAVSLQNNNEELASMNEELQAQAEELQAQSEELQSQSAELISKQKQVEEADRLKSEFLSNMSHELRTPLNSIMALSQLMMARGPSQNRGQDIEFLEVIDRNGRHLLNLINEILDLSKIEAGRVDVKISQFAPSKVVEEALETIRPLAEKKGLNIMVRPGRATTLCSDIDSVRQILINLLSNAVKFTQEGEIEISVNRTSGRNVCFTVKDTGPGIAPDALNYIFDEFRQVDGSTTRSHEGTGLGLTICKKLAHILNGEISVESEPGKGSLFTLTLPAGPPGLMQTEFPSPDLLTDMTNKEGPAPTAPKTEGQKDRKPSILLAEDNPVAVLQVRSALEENGYRVIAANGGEQAFSAIANTMPEGIILDLMMPEIDGFEVLRRLRSTPLTANLPVLVLTAMELSNEDRTLLGTLGVEQTLQKGNMDRAELIDNVNRLVKPPQPRITPSACDPEASVTVAPLRGKLLIVEDNPDNRFTLEALLEDLGIGFATAENGLQAVEMARELLPPLILMDIHLPELNGLDATRQLKSSPETAQIPVVALTARAMKGDKESILAAGCDGYLSKPIDPQELSATLKNWLPFPQQG